MAIPFRQLVHGEHFRFVGAAPATPPKKKVSDRCYVFPAKEYVLSKRRGRITGKAYTAYVKRTRIMKHCMTRESLDMAVDPTGRTSAVRKRKGRGRGAAQLGRWR